MQTPKIEPDDAFFYKGKDKKFKWCTVPSGHHNEPKTMFQRSANLKGNAVQAGTPEQCFQLFFTPETISQIVSLTNSRIDHLVEPSSREDISYTDEVELKAFLALLILSGLYLYENIRELWDSNGFGIDMFRTTIGSSRFMFLLRCIQFVEDENSITNVFTFINTFNRNCQAALDMSSYVTIEEQHIPFRGEFPDTIKQYSHTKRYGIRFVSVRDSRLHYTHSMLIHQNSEQLNDVIVKLTNRLHDIDRLVLADKRFTNLDLVSHFTSFNVFFLGEIKNTASEIPSEFSTGSITSEGRNVSVFHDNLSLICQLLKKDQVSLFVSNMNGVKDNEDCIIETYDALAGQPDVVDSMCKSYSCTKRTKRWDLPILFRLIDVACINAQVIYTINNPSDNLSRRNFLKTLVTDLVKSQLLARVNQVSLSTTTRQAAAKLAKVDMNPVNPIDDSLLSMNKGRRKRCQFCPRPNDCKTAYSCHGCKRPLCRKRGFLFCRDCVNVEEDDTAMEMYD